MKSSTKLNLKNQATQKNKRPTKQNPTFSNIYRKDEDKEEFFSDIPYFADYLQTVARLFDFPIASVLDMGCGKGQYGELMRQTWGPELKTYLGVELDKDLVERIQKPFIVQGDLLNFKSRKKFDIVLCHSVIQYIEHPEMAFKKLHALVKKTGFVSVFQTMTAEDYKLYRQKTSWSDPYAWKHTTEEIRRALFKYFDVLSYGILVPKGSLTKDPYTADKLFLFQGKGLR